MSAAANSYDALKNHLLAALSADEFRRVKSKLEPLSFKLGEVIYESGDKIDYVYFPTGNCLNAVRYGEWRDRRNRSDWKRWFKRTCALFGRRHDHEPEKR